MIHKAPIIINYKRFKNSHQFINIELIQMNLIRNLKNGHQNI